MVESEKKDIKQLVKANDLEFAVDEDIIKIASIFGGIIIDYTKTIYQKGFVVRIGRGGSC